MTVDTLSLAKELRAAELSSTQAEAIAAAIGRSVTGVSATKADLEQAKLELRTGIGRLRGSMLTWFIATIISLTGVIIAVAKL